MVLARLWHAVCAKSSRIPPVFHAGEVRETEGALSDGKGTIWEPENPQPRGFLNLPVTVLKSKSIAAYSRASGFLPL